MLTKQDFCDCALTINVQPAVIQAVAQVESGGDGFLKNGEPKILFEPHIFWKELKKRGIDPEKHIAGNEDILYPVWGTKPYGEVSQQHARLDRAVQIHRQAALASASWGKFQIMGFNWPLCQCKDLQHFITRMYKNEAEHLKMFVTYIKAAGLDDELQNLDWKGFARGYNGPLYTRNKYDTLLKEAYKLFTK